MRLLKRVLIALSLAVTCLAYVAPTHVAANQTVTVYGDAGRVASPLVQEASFIGPRRALLAGGNKTLGPAWLGDFTTAALPAGVTVSSPSLGGLVTDSTGKLTYKPNNLLAQSASLTTTPWVVTNAAVTPNAAPAPDGTNTAAFVVTANTANYNIGLYQAFHAPYRKLISVYAKAGTAGYLVIDASNGAGLTTTAGFDLVHGTVQGQGSTSLTITSTGIVSVGGGWYQCWLGLDDSTGAEDIVWLASSTNGATGVYNRTITGDGVSGVYVWHPTLSAVTYETTPRPGDQVITTSSAYYGPAFDYDPVTLQPLGLRIWENRINLATYSVPNGNWTPNSTVLTTNAASAPDGTTTATKVVAATSGGIYVAAPANVSTTSAIAVATIYAKAAGVNYAYIYMGEDGGAAHRFGAVYDLTTGAVTQTTLSGGVTGSASAGVSVGNGWWRLQIAITAGGLTGSTASLAIGTSSTATLGSYNATYLYSTTAGDGVNGVYYWGGQYEQGASFAGPYIPTGSVAVTAAADVVNIPSPTWLSSTQGTFVVSADTGKSSGQGAGIFVASDGSAANRIIVMQNFVGSNLQASMVSGGSETDLTTVIGALANTTYRTAMAYGAGRFSASSNGGTVVSGAHAIPTINQIGLGYFYPGLPNSNYLDGHIQGFAYYNLRLPDATLKAKSVVGAPF